MNDLWAAELKAVNHYYESLKAYEAIEKRADLFSANDEDMPDIWVKQGNVGVINISGTLIEGSAGWLGALFGMTGYQDIADATAKAMADPEVQSLVYNVNSGGGMVDGIDTALDTIRAAKEVLPTYTQASYMASAALWLGSATGDITASRMAEVGSVGVYATAVDRSKELEQRGVTVHIVRSDPDKAPVQSTQPMDDKALDVLKEGVEKTRDIFVADLAQNYGVSASFVKKNFGAGKMFFVDEAIDHKLVHHKGTLSETVARASRIGKRRSKIK